MKKTRLELPDGRLVTIEGEDKDTIATFIANNYFGHGLPVKNINQTVKVTEYTPVVEPLPVPAMSFVRPSGTPRGRTEPAVSCPITPVSNVPTATVNGVEALPLPTMNFDQKPC